MGFCLFDTHCDTPYEMFKRNKGLRSEELHVSLDYAKRFDAYLQCAAVWSNKKLSDDEAYVQFRKISSYFRAACNSDSEAALCRTYKEAEAAISQRKAAFILTVEDARLLSGDIRRLDVLRDEGVRILTFQWQGETCVGGGFDTDIPLSPFGRELMYKCADFKIIADISHACDRTAIDMLCIADECSVPVIATHSNSYTVCPHPRNLKDGILDKLVCTGGIVGISMAPQHLSPDGRANAETVFSHIEHYAKRGYEKHICLGCDFDGIETTPSDISNLGKAENIAECMLKHNYPEDTVRDIMSENARRFFEKNLV